MPKLQLDHLTRSRFSQDIQLLDISLPLAVMVVTTSKGPDIYQNNSCLTHYSYSRLYRTSRTDCFSFRLDSSQHPSIIPCLLPHPRILSENVKADETPRSRREGSSVVSPSQVSKVDTEHRVLMQMK